MRTRGSMYGEDKARGDGTQESNLGGAHTLRGVQHDSGSGGALEQRGGSARVSIDGVQASDKLLGILSHGSVVLHSLIDFSEGVEVLTFSTWGIIRAFLGWLRFLPTSYEFQELFVLLYQPLIDQPERVQLVIFGEVPHRGIIRWVTLGLSAIRGFLLVLHARWVGLTPTHVSGGNHQSLKRSALFVIGTVVPTDGAKLMVLM